MPLSRVLALTLALALAACDSGTTTTTTPKPSVTARPLPTHLWVPSTTASPKHHTRREAVASLMPGFSWKASPVTATELGKSWHPGCPVRPSDLRTLHLSIWGFDGHAHPGALVINARVVRPVVAAFRLMYLAKFPIRQMRPVAAYGGIDNRSMAHDNTSAFNCRYAVANGPKHWSMHAFGEAVDLDPLENPYYLDGLVYPPKGARYLRRSHVRSGMVVAGSAPVRAFASVGWGWGGNWSSSPDYQHFSSSGE